MKRKVIILSIFLMLLFTVITIAGRKSKNSIQQQTHVTETEEANSLDLENIIVQKIKNVLYFFYMF